MKTVSTLIVALSMAVAMNGSAWAGEKRKIRRPQLSSQVLSASYKADQTVTLLKAQHQVRLQRPRPGKY